MSVGDANSLSESQACQLKAWLLLSSATEDGTHSCLTALTVGEDTSPVDCSLVTPSPVGQGSVRNGARLNWRFVVRASCTLV